MKIAIVGAGFTGLTASLRLAKVGHKVTVFEKENHVGGLAAGFREQGWDWPLEHHYHHIFASDKHIRRLAEEIGHEYKFYDVKTSSVFGEENLEYWQMDSPVHLLKFKRLGWWDRVRMGAVLGYMRYLANWRSLDQKHAALWLRKMMGRAGYETIWEPLMKGKFGAHHEEVNAAWFWARIKARTKKLGYFKGGFAGFLESLADAARTSGVEIRLNYPLTAIDPDGGKWRIGKEEFDKVIVASTANVVEKLVQNLPESFREKTKKLNGLGTVNLILRLKEDFLPESIYWLNVHVKDWPMLAIVEHTHMINKVHYHNENLVYVAKYLPYDHEFMKLTDEQLLNKYSPYLNAIHPGWRTKLVNYRVFRAAFTQPVMPVGMANRIPPFDVGLPGLYMAGMQQVYPWDRGTNFAVELGEKIAAYVQ